MSSTRKITLTSSDGESFEVDEAVALQLQVIKDLIEDDCAYDSIPLPNVTGNILAKVIEYCKKHVETSTAEGGAADDELKNWDAEFVMVDGSILYDLMRAANYLNIKGLLDLTRQTVVDMIMGMIMRTIPDDIRNISIKKIVFTPWDGEEVCQENL